MEMKKDFTFKKSKSEGKKEYAKPKKTFLDLDLFLADSDQYSIRNIGLDLSYRLQAIPFDIISIPVVVSKAKVFNNDTAKGFVTVGYIRSFDPQKLSFSVSIFSKWEDIITDPEKTTVLVNVRKDRDGDVRQIISFELSDNQSITEVLL